MEHNALGSAGQLEREVDESIAHAEREVREHGDNEAESNVWQEAHVRFHESSGGRVSHGLQINEQQGAVSDSFDLRS